MGKEASATLADKGKGTPHSTVSWDVSVGQVEGFFLLSLLALICTCGWFGDRVDVGRGIRKGGSILKK
jgi:hypothetical protein